MTRHIGRFDGLLASVVGLLTIAYWLRADTSPFATLAHATDWLGIDIRRALADADTWLNTDHRHDALVIGGAAVVLAVLALQAHRLTKHHEEIDAICGIEDRDERLDAFREEQLWMRLYEGRFWSVVWVMTGLLAQLRQPTLALGLLALILAVRGVAECANRGALHGGTIVESVIASATWAALTVASLPLRIFGLLAHPGAPGDPEPPAREAHQ